MTVVAFIPARKGSTRVPHKNRQEVGGVSLVERACNVAREAGCDRIVVSTDDQALMLPAWIEWHDRPPVLADAHAQIEDAIAHWLRRADLRNEDVIVLLQPTSPFRRAETVRACIEAARSHGCAVSVTRNPSHYFAGMITEEGEFSPRHTVQTRPRSQELSAWAAPDGSCWAFTVAHFEATRNRTSRRAHAVVTTWPECLEIDTPEDLEVARLLAPLADGRDT